MVYVIFKGSYPCTILKRFANKPQSITFCCWWHGLYTIFNVSLSYLPNNSDTDRRINALYVTPIESNINILLSFASLSLISNATQDHSVIYNHQHRQLVSFFVFIGSLNAYITHTIYSGYFFSINAYATSICYHIIWQYYPIMYNNICHQYEIFPTKIFVVVVAMHPVRSALIHAGWWCCEFGRMRYHAMWIRRMLITNDSC